MKKISDWILSWFSPTKEKEIETELDSLNISNIYYVSLAVGIVQLISLILFLCFNGLTERYAVGVFIRVGLSIVLCLIAFLISRRLLKTPDTVRDHPKATQLFTCGFLILLIIWGIFVSIDNYVNQQQLLTFYTIELLTVMFIRLSPVKSAVIIIGSHIANYLILNFGFAQGQINPYNYMMFGFLSATGAIINYRLTVNYISEKNKANKLNEALEIIANHDSNTRLQNRYALNQHIPEYFDKDICVAMGDINSFKSVNDTYGHHIGDEVLKTFADILLEFFPDEAVFRYGGDEFLIIEISVDLNEFKERLDGVNKRFASASIEGVNKELGCSFGCIKARPKDPADFFFTLTEADKILYKEKEKINALR